MSEAEPGVPAAVHVRTLGSGPTVVLVHAPFIERLEELLEPRRGRARLTTRAG